MTTLIKETWVRHALCVTRSVDPDWFHPGKRTRPRDVAAALALCAECPVREECLRNALRLPRPMGDLGRHHRGAARRLALGDGMTDVRPRKPASRTLDELLTPDEVSAILKVTKPWLYAQVQRGRFPVVRFNGRSLRFKASDIQRYIDRQYTA